MTLYFPEGVSAEGNIKVAFVPVIADLNAPKAATEVAATGSVPLSRYITNEFGVGGEQATGEDRRLESKRVFQVLGRLTNSIAPIEYVYDPQADAGAVDNKAYDTLKQDIKGFLVVRYGLDAQEIDWEAGQKVDIVPITCGAQIKLGNAGSDEFAKLRIQQTFAIRDLPVEDVELAA